MEGYTAGDCRLLTPLLLWEIHAAHEILKARVGAQGIEHWVDFQVYKPEGVILISLSQPCDDEIFVVETRVDDCEVVRRDISSPGKMLQGCKVSLCSGSPARNPQGMPKR